MNYDYRPDPQFMRIAIDEALKAREYGDYAIGAVVVKDGIVIAKSGNRVKKDSDPTQHAEIAALRLACKAASSRHLLGAVIYTTAEPCPMCCSGAVWARLSGIVSGSTVSDMAEFSKNFGNEDWSWRTFDVAARTILAVGNPKLFLIEGFLRDECKDLFHKE